MREGPEDGDQDLNLLDRELEDVVREIMDDPNFKGNQKYSFEMDLDEAGKRLYGGEANAGVTFQIGRIGYIIEGSRSPLNRLLNCLLGMWLDSFQERKKEMGNVTRLGASR
jgi:hypothetical protein